MNISLKQKISIIGLGSISTLLILLMLEVAFAQFLTNTLIGNINDNVMLLVIIVGLLIFTMIIAFIVGFFVTQDIALKSVRNASIMSLLCLVFMLFAMCNIVLYLNYREIYDNVIGFEIFWVFPQVLVYFSIYILGDVFSLFILEIIIYYLFFVFFLDKLYISKKVDV